MAHKLTLYARQALPEGAPVPKQQLAMAGESRPKIAGKKAGEVSVTYAAGASSFSNASAALQELAETSFGQQLLSLVRLYGRSVYVP